MATVRTFANSVLKIHPLKVITTKAATKRFYGGVPKIGDLVGISGGGWLKIRIEGNKNAGEYYSGNWTELKDVKKQHISKKL